MADRSQAVGERVGQTGCPGCWQESPNQGRVLGALPWTLTVKSRPGLLSQGHVEARAAGHPLSKDTHLPRHLSQYDICSQRILTWGWGQGEILADVRFPLGQPRLREEKKCGWTLPRQWPRRDWAPDPRLPALRSGLFAASGINPDRSLRKPPATARKASRPPAPNPFPLPSLPRAHSVP